MSLFHSSQQTTDQSHLVCDSSVLLEIPALSLQKLQALTGHSIGPSSATRFHPPCAQHDALARSDDV